MDKVLTKEVFEELKSHLEHLQEVLYDDPEKVAKLEQGIQWLCHQWHNQK